VSRTGGHAVVEALVAEGVEVVFGIPGTHNLEIYRALGESNIRAVTPRHEQGAGYAADAYTRVSGRPGVVVPTTGPGLTNATTAAATAYADSIPMLLISPGMPRGLVRMDGGWLHEMKDQQAHLEAAVERSIRVESAQEAASAVRQTFTKWRTGRRRPVHIEVPLDVLDGDYQDGEPTAGQAESTQAPSGVTIAGPIPAAAAVAEAARVLAYAESVVVVAGGGARFATSELRELAEALDAPVLTTVNGKGALPETHRLSLGASIRLAEAHRVISDADALLVVGSVLGDDELWGHTVQPGGPVVRVDVEAVQLDKNLAPTHPLHGDAAATLAALRRALPATVRGTLGRKAEELRGRLEEEALRDGRPYAAYHRALREVLPAETVIAGDSAQVSYFGTAHQWPSLRPGQFVYPAGFATLGYGIPAGIGAALAAPGTPVVVMCGDGGVMFTVQEFATAADLGLGLPVVVFNNGGFQEIRQEMRDRGFRPLAVDVRSPDFPLLAQALGGHGGRAHTPEALATAVRDALRRDRPTLIEVPLPITD
jgi:thiamine pyrophosphate-dependent acetolactate synthase large subunit-like protein